MARALLLAHASKLADQVRMLTQDALLQRVPLLARHRSDIERVARLFVLRLLQLRAVHQPHVRDRGATRLARILVCEPPSQRLKDGRPVVVQGLG
jgi:hypothetical protein